jgi:photosystem II stability/assembly factor-like uncharacterized protein
MLPRLFRPSFLAGLTLLGLLTIMALPAVSEEPAAHQKEITDLEKQIQELNKKLSALKANGNGSVASAAVNPATADNNIPADWIKALTWRPIGPASMGGRITAVSVFPGDLSTYWIATASGGLLKTENNGNTFAHQFDREATVSIGDVCVAPSDKNIVWVGTGEANPRNSVSYGDGVYKSTDGGKTWTNMGLKKTFQIGKILVHPKDPNIVYVGALGRLYGPNEDRGLYKTTDGGKTWNKILYTDDRTGVIDMRMSPADPETLLVAMYERKRDEFDSWVGTAISDGYDGYDPVKKFGPSAGLYRTTDGGRSFKRITKGLPTCNLGRIGIDWYLKDPKHVYAIIESEKIGMGPPPAAPKEETYFGVTGGDADAGARLLSVLPGGPAEKAGLKAQDIVISINDKMVLTYPQLDDQIKKMKPGEVVKLKVVREKKLVEVSATLAKKMVEPPRPQRGGGGGGNIGAFGAAAESATRPFTFMYSGQQPNVQDKQGAEGVETGGVYKSVDGGETWTRINSLNPRPMYFSQVRVDPSDEKYLYVLGISMYTSDDNGKTFKVNGNGGLHPDQHCLWIDPKDGRHMVVGCDGGYYSTYDRMANWEHLNHMAIGQFYHVAVDSKRPYRAFGGLQDNGSWGIPSHSLSAQGPSNDDSLMIGGGDGFVCRVDANDSDIVYFESQDGNINRRNLRTGEFGFIRPRDPGLQTRYDWKNPQIVPLWNLPFLPPIPKAIPPKATYNFNWNTPFILSAHNPRIFYSAGNFVFRSLKQGDEIKVISPKITRTDRGTGTALSESPRNPDVIYAGTDDGGLWLTRDGGANWTDIAKNVPLPGPRWVATIEASRYAEGRAYVVFDAHRSNDDEPYAFVTEDFGQTWKSLRANLPTCSTRCLREDIANPNLLFLGTEFGAWTSLNRGQSWVKLNNNLPTVAVHDFAIHPTAGEMVAATHGRSLWVLDITPLRGMTPDALKAKAHLYAPNTVVRWRSEPQRNSMYGSGAKRFVGQNAPSGAQIFYSLTKKPEKIDLKVMDYSGKAIRTLNTFSTPGLHKIAWDLTGTQAQPPPDQAGGGRGRGFRFGSLYVQPGVYRLVLTVDGEEQSQLCRVEADPVTGSAIIAPEIEEDD